MPARHRRRRHRRQRRADHRLLLRRAEEDGADLAAFPELAITGYPPEDLLLKPAFVGHNLAALQTVAAATSACVALVGFVDVVGHEDLDDAVARADGAGAVAREAAIRGAPRRLRNALAVCARGGVLGVYHKRRLPNYGVFDEERWFAPGDLGARALPRGRHAAGRLDVRGPVVPGRSRLRSSPPAGPGSW